MDLVGNSHGKSIKQHISRGQKPGWHRLKPEAAAAEERLGHLDEAREVMRADLHADPRPFRVGAFVVSSVFASSVSVVFGSGGFGGMGQKKGAESRWFFSRKLAKQRKTTSEKKETNRRDTDPKDM